MTAKGNMLIAHGGGPTPVINSSLQGAVEEAKCQPDIGIIYGARFGAEGILKGDLVNLGAIADSELAKLTHTPASAIGSCRRKLADADYPHILETFKKYDIRYFFYNGGNDSMDTCHKIHQLAQKEGYDVNIIGIPKTIDNDLAETDHSPGYGSAAQFAAVSAAELAMDVAALPIHVVVMEVMGRNTGWITAATSLFSDEMPCELLVYLPELPLAKEKFLADVKQAWARGKGVLVCASEGLKDTMGNAYGDTGVRDGFGHMIPGGTAQALVDLLLTETKLKARAEKPGLLGRVSIAHQSQTDQKEAYDAGVFAVKSAAEGKSGYMVSIQAQRQPGYSAHLELAPLEKVANVEKTFPKEWIVPEGNGIASGFADYALPILGAPSPKFAFYL